MNDLEVKQFCILMGRVAHSLPPIYLYVSIHGMVVAHSLPPIYLYVSIHGPHGSDP